MNKKTKKNIRIGIILAITIFALWIVIGISNNEEKENQHIPYSVAVSMCESFSFTKEEMIDCLERKGISFDRYQYYSCQKSFEGKELCDCVKSAGIELFCDRGILNTESCLCIYTLDK